MLWQIRAKMMTLLQPIQRHLRYTHCISEATNNIGVAFSKQDRFSDAIQKYNKALSINPYYRAAWVNGAEILEKWNKLDDLHDWLERAKAKLKVVPADVMYFEVCLAAPRANRRP